MNQLKIADFQMLVYVVFIYFYHKFQTNLQQMLKLIVGNNFCYTVLTMTVIATLFNT